MTSRVECGQHNKNTSLLAELLSSNKLLKPRSK